MKLKAVMSPNLPLRLAMAFIHPSLDTWYKREVVMGCLRVERTNPAGHYIQWPDFMVEQEDGACGVEVFFSKLSGRFDRSGLDFHKARLLVQGKFVELIEHNLVVGRHLSLYVGSQTNKPTEYPEGNFDSLHELDYVWVEGKAEPDAELDVRADEYTFKPLRRARFSTKPTDDAIPVLLRHIDEVPE